MFGFERQDRWEPADNYDEEHAASPGDRDADWGASHPGKCHGKVAV
jgi:hypothetical protein